MPPGHDRSVRRSKCNDVRFCRFFPRSALLCRAPPFPPFAVYPPRRASSASLRLRSWQACPPVLLTRRAVALREPQGDPEPFDHAHGPEFVERARPKGRTGPPHPVPLPRWGEGVLGSLSLDAWLPQAGQRARVRVNLPRAMTAPDVFPFPSPPRFQRGGEGKEKEREGGGRSPPAIKWSPRRLTRGKGP